MKHLTDAQFTECLTAEKPEPAVQAHLAQCDACRMELGTFLAAMDEFSAAAMEWSKAQPTRMKEESAARRPAMVAPLRWALAAAAIAAVGVPVAVHHERAGAGNGGPVVVANAGDSAAQIAQDNRLMESVDGALAENDPSPYREYGLDVTGKRARGRAQARVE